MKKALITGITGQDGSYLSELLLEKGYEVHGIIRRVALEDPLNRLQRINHIKNKLILHPGTIDSYARLSEIMDTIKPDECYHLAAQSFVHESFEDSFSTFMTNINGTLNILNATHKKSPKCKFYFAGSSEMFGAVEEIPQKETTKFHPRSPYGITKVTGFEMTRNFREAYNLFSTTGILFNHESPRRGYEFVTRKITNSLARMKKGLDNIILLGNLEACRDWGFAGDYVKAMWKMLQQETPEDFVISTGKTYSVKNFLEIAAEKANVKYNLIDIHNLEQRKADKIVEKLKQKKKDCFIVQYPKFYRPSEVDLLVGDSTKAKKTLGWENEVSFEELITQMIDNDLKLLG